MWHNDLLSTLDHGDTPISFLPEHITKHPAEYKLFTIRSTQIQLDKSTDECNTILNAYTK